MNSVILVQSGVIRSLSDMTAVVASVALRAKGMGGTVKGYGKLGSSSEDVVVMETKLKIIEILEVNKHTDETA